MRESEMVNAESKGKEEKLKCVAECKINKQDIDEKDKREK